MPQSQMPFGMEMRRFAEQSVEQARKAFMDFAEAAQNSFATAEGSARATQEGFADLNRQALAYAEENLRSTFDFMTRLSRVRTLDEAATVQQDFFRQQAATATAQAEGLGRAFTAAAEAAAKPRR